MPTRLLYSLHVTYNYVVTSQDFTLNTLNNGWKQIPQPTQFSVNPNT